MLLKLTIAIGVVVAVAALARWRRRVDDQVLSDAWRREQIRRS